ncbi:MAG TPA: hypothetical protein VFS43_44455 [Polyangiaceae bacterium]|nr:hypothetical protein [Polyangiaceae bacterium]
MSTLRELADGQKTIGALRYRLTAEAGYALVVYEGAPATLTEVDLWERDIDAFLRASRLSRVVWDSRPGSPLSREVRAHVWAWLERAEIIKVSAIVVTSELLRVSGNMSSVSRGLRLRSFHDLESAVAWVLKQPG